jgi:hypothetical protein
MTLFFKGGNVEYLLKITKGYCCGLVCNDTMWFGMFQRHIFSSIFRAGKIPKWRQYVPLKP